MTAGSHYNVQLTVDQVILSRNATVTISGNRAVAYVFRDGRHHRDASLKILRTKDYGQKIFLWGTGPDDPETEVFWSVNRNPRQPCNCGGKEKVAHP